MYQTWYKSAPRSLFIALKTIFRRYVLLGEQHANDRQTFRRDGKKLNKTDRK